MIKEKITLELEAYGSDDEKNTYEVRRTWGDKGKKALVVELYPTLSAAEQCLKNDLSSLHLTNHVGDFGWGEIRLLNLYSKVFTSKPLVSELGEEDLNLAYIEEALEAEEIKNVDIVIAWGSSLLTHKLTNNAKLDLLYMLKDKGLEKQAKCIVADGFSPEDAIGVHPLFLGLKYSKETWKLKPFPVNQEIKRLEDMQKETEKDKKGGSKHVPKNPK